MSLNRTLLTIGGAALALAVGTAAVSAATAFASSTVNVRSGPGTGYGIVDALYPGERVDVDHCRGAWCFVEKRGPDGWVNANYLTQDRDRWDRYEDDEDPFPFYIVRPHFRPIYPFHRPVPRSQVCVGGSNASFCITD